MSCRCLPSTELIGPSTDASWQEELATVWWYETTTCQIWNVKCWPRSVPVRVLILMLESQPLCPVGGSVGSCPNLVGDLWDTPPGPNLSWTEEGGWSLVESPSTLARGSPQPQEPSKAGSPNMWTISVYQPGAAVTDNCPRLTASIRLR